MCKRNAIDAKNEIAYQKYIDKYPSVLENYELSMYHKTSYTRKAYLRHAAIFLDYAVIRLGTEITDGHELENIKPIDIERYMEKTRYKENGEEKSATYRITQLAAIDGLFKYLVKNNLVTANPCLCVDRPKDNKEHEVVVMNTDDIDEMIYNIRHGINTYQYTTAQKKWKKRDELILVLGITTGLRIGAIVGIDIEDINFEENYIRVNEKGNIDRKVYIGKKTMKLIFDWIRDRKELTQNTTGPLFICNGNKRMTVRTMENIIKNISGGKYTPHKMRATCATRLYEATGDIYRVQQQLGHKSIKNTERYAKVSEKAKIESANILDSMF